MPDRFDLSASPDLEVSLRLAVTFCKRANPGSIPVQQQHHLDSARTYLAEQRVVIQQWLDGTLRMLGDCSELPPPTGERMDTQEALRSFGDAISEMAPDTLRFARPSDTVYSLPADGRVMAIDFARHIVRVTCCATIDRGWTWPD